MAHASLYDRLLQFEGYRQLTTGHDSDAFFGQLKGNLNCNLPNVRTPASLQKTTLKQDLLCVRVPYTELCCAESAACGVLL